MPGLFDDKQEENKPEETFEEPPKKRKSSSNKEDKKKQKGKVVLVGDDFLVADVNGNGVRIGISKDSNKEYKIGDEIEI